MDGGERQREREREKEKKRERQRQREGGGERGKIVGGKGSMHENWIGPNAVDAMRLKEDKEEETQSALKHADVKRQA